MRNYIIWLSASIWRVFALYVASLVLCACLFSVIEGRTVAESLWWAGVTSLTIGYGDITPVTHAGRVTAMVFSHLWIFGIAPMVITNMLSVSMEDRNKFTHDEQEEIKNLLRTLAENTKMVPTKREEV
ncbi:Ion channel [compost metagenome]